MLGRIVIPLLLILTANGGSPDWSSRCTTWMGQWQQQLGLSEWRITVKFVRSWELPPATLALVRWSLPESTAVMRVLDPRDLRLPPDAALRETELSIVHELVHLRMARLPTGRETSEAEEEAVSRIAEALVSARLRGSGKFP